MPAKKVDFKVVYASGEDERFPAAELNSDRHGPLAQGWISENKKIRLKKVQILSHQFLIATKIEFFIGDLPEKPMVLKDSPKGSNEAGGGGGDEDNDNLDSMINHDHDDSNYQRAKYTRLGYVELASNERTDFKARELKSVHVDAEGSFMKLVLHKNFVNKLNSFNQIGVVAINIIGNDLDDLDLHSNRLDHVADPSVLAVVKRPDYISPLDDLAFAMYQDQEISAIIIDLDKKKTECVLNEKYDDAKKLKIAINELYKIGERLARYDIEKRQALEEEDYEKAKFKKYQIQEYRRETYKQLEANNLLAYIDSEDMKENVKKKGSLPHYKYNRETTSYEYSEKRDDEESSSGEEIPSSFKDPDRDSDRGGRRDESPVYAKSLNTARQSVTTQMISPRNSNRFEQPSGDLMYNKPSTPYDERVIPTLRNNNSKSRMEKPIETLPVVTTTTKNRAINEEDQYDNETNGDPENLEAEAYDPMDGTEEMTEKEVREANQMNQYLGKQIVTKLYSKNFQNREDALAEVHANLQNFKGDKEEARLMFRASAYLVAKMCRDNVFSIFNNSVKLLDFLLKDFAQKHAIGKADITFLLEQVLPVLIHRTGDTNNTRLRMRSQEYIVQMASYSEVKPSQIVPHYCIHPMSLNTAPRLALSRVETLEELIKRLGTKDNGLTVDNISKFCTQALEHNAGEVRELSQKILIEMYKLNGSVVRKYVPVDSEMNRKIKKYRILYDAFDTIDGKPVQSYDRQNDYGNSHTPRFNRSSQVKTPSKSKSRATSLERKTPMSMADESEYNPDNTCMFCGEVNEKFVKQGFDMHYWKSCPMLKQCNHCKQIIEISVQNEHLLTECQQKANYKRCPRCNEAVNTTNKIENELHFTTKQCVPMDKKSQRCPLCHATLGNGEDVWKEHLMGPNGCTKNPRNLDSDRRQSIKK